MFSKVKHLSLILVSFGAFSAYAAEVPTYRFDPNSISCYVNFSKIECESSGYWSGYNSISYRSSFNDRRGITIDNIYSFGSKTTNTGVLGAATLGVSDALANQVNAIAARKQAKSEVNEVMRTIKIHIPKCK